MKTLKKALYIGLDATLVPIGLGMMVVFGLLNNVEMSTKILGIAGGGVVVVFGWWFMRRVSKSVWEALDWLVFHLLP